MALLKGIKRKKPTRPSRRIRAGDLKDPSWEGASDWSGEEMHRKLSGATDYYYRNYKAAILHGYAYDWMLENGYSKYDVRCAKASKGGFGCHLVF